MLPTEQVNILGVQISAINMPDTLGVIDHYISNRLRGMICLANVYTIMYCQDHEDLRRVYRDSALVTPDGMPLVWLSWLNKQRQVRRVYGPDLMLEVCEKFKTCRHFFYGSTDAVLSALTHRLQSQYPGLIVAGTFAPPFRMLTVADDIKVMRTINESQADIVWVGLGAPKQEIWMAAHRDQLTAPLLIGVGAAFDFLSNNKRQSPRILQRAGLEWLWRLVIEPRRLWRRYALTIPPFILLSFAQLLKIKRYQR